MRFYENHFIIKHKTYLLLFNTFQQIKNKNHLYFHFERKSNSKIFVHADIVLILFKPEWSTYTLMSSFWVAEVERVKQFRPWLTLNRDDALILGVRLELKHALWCHGNISTPWFYWGFKSLVFNHKFIFKNELFIFSINVISKKKQMLCWNCVCWIYNLHIDFLFIEN